MFYKMPRPLQFLNKILLLLLNKSKNEVALGNAEKVVAEAAEEAVDAARITKNENLIAVEVARVQAIAEKEQAE